MTEERYNFRLVERKWREFWTTNNSFAVGESKPHKKYYVLEMFPYPSGKLHIGHVRNYIIGDIIARFKKAQGYDVLHPMGWDAFGLPAENAALEHNIHPEEWTKDNINNMRKEFETLGLSFDWTKEFASCDKEYYGLEQSILLDFYQQGLLYQKESYVNWDPVEKSVLANEQVVNGRGWRSGVPIEQKLMKQWYLKITDFAEELLQGLDKLNGWPEKVKTMQKNWIGKSDGAYIDFELLNHPDQKINDIYIKIFTSRPETIFGASFLGISFDHPIAHQIAKENKEVQQFINLCKSQTIDEQTIETTEKTGIFANLYVVHPCDKSKKIPVYIANFVLMNYGTGAIFGCPAHDQRDLDFAHKYNLAITPVVRPNDQQDITINEKAYTENGIMCNSQFLDGMSTEQAKIKILEHISSNNIGKKCTLYRLRDWCISRQRYWGCPIPFVNCDTCGTVPENKTRLPIALPKDIKLNVSGNPLQQHNTWQHTKCPKCNKDAKRETDTLDTFFESSWYFLRFASQPNNSPFVKDEVDHWLPIDKYIGGIEHAVLHLLYARFFTKALKKCGYLSVDEPFKALITQGMVCHETYTDNDGKWLYPEEVYLQKGKAYKLSDKSVVTVGKPEKMSKSKKNVIQPMSIIDAYGVDATRLFVVSDSPVDKDIEWNESGIQGVWKLINKIWRLVNTWTESNYPDTTNSIEYQLNKNELKIKTALHKAIKNITEDIEQVNLNLYIAHIRTLINELAKVEDIANINGQLKQEIIETLAIIINPASPHLAEEIWQTIGNKTILAKTPWPKCDESLLQSNKIVQAIQVNGKLRATITIDSKISKDELQTLALEHCNVKKYLDNRKIKKIIVIPGKIVNVVC